LTPNSQSQHSQLTAASKKSALESKKAVQWAPVCSPAIQPLIKDRMLTSAAKQVKKSLRKTCPQIKVLEPQKGPVFIGHNLSRNLVRVERFGFKFTLILLYVAIRQIGCNLCFSDLVR